MNTQLTIPDLPGMSVGEINALDAKALAIFQEQIGLAMEKVKLVKELLDGVLSQRYADQAAKNRLGAGKEFGTTRFNDGDIQVVSTLPKRPVWDQKMLGDIVERIRQDGADPMEYVEVAFKVPERRFTAWPRHIKEVFVPARTVKPGRHSIQLKINHAKERA